MASISTTREGLRAIQFVAANGKRKTIRLGRVSMKTAETIKFRIETLAAAQIANLPIDRDTANWLAGCGNDLAGKLAAVGLTAERHQFTLEQFLKSYMELKKGLKKRSRINLEYTKRSLVEFFGAGRSVREVTPRGADEWTASLRDKYSDATIGGMVKRARQVFALALRWGMTASPENPMAGVKAPGQSNAAKSFHVSREAAAMLMEAAPDRDWRLLIPLSRFGGLRVPSETCRLTWDDVDWEGNKVWITSPKTEHHEGGGGRWLPLFPELWPHLEACFEAAEPGAKRRVTGHFGPREEPEDAVPQDH